MVITQRQFEQAMTEINESYARLVERIETIEKKLETQNKTTTRNTKEKA